MDIVVKMCKKCNVEKNIDKFTPAKNCKDGTRNMCKDCTATYKREYAIKNKEKIKAYKADYHIANIETIKEKRKSYHKANAAAINKRAKEWAQNNTDRAAANKRRHYANNVDVIKARAKKWGEDNIERVKNNRKLYYKNNIEQITKMHKIQYDKIKNTDAYKKRRKEYIASIKDTAEYKAKRASLQNKRKASKLNRTPGWLTEDDYWLMEQAYIVAWERTATYGIQFHVDHIIPLRGKTVSGFHCPANLQVITAKENMMKSNKYQYNDGGVL